MLSPQAPSVEDTEEDLEEKRKAEDGEGNRPKDSLLIAAAKRRLGAAPETEEKKQLDEEQDIMKHVLQKQALKAVKELAQVRSMWSSACGMCTNAGMNACKRPHAPSHVGLTHAIAKWVAVRAQVDSMPAETGPKSKYNAK